MDQERVRAGTGERRAHLAQALVEFLARQQRRVPIVGPGQQGGLQCPHAITPSVAQRLVSASPPVAVTRTGSPQRR